MARPDLGRKLTCGACAARFYDLARLPARCPACGAEQAVPKPRPVALPRPSGRAFGGNWAGRRPVAAAAVVAEAALVIDDDAAPLLDDADADSEADAEGEADEEEDLAPDADAA